MRILIHGAGAVGQAVGGLLAENGHEVTLLLRPASARAIAAQGLRIVGIFGDHHVPASRVRLVTDSEELLPVASGSSGARRDFDYVLVTVKSYDTPTAVEQLRTLDLGAATVVSLQNGYGNVEQLSEAFGGGRVLGGRVITGFVSEQPGVVRITVHADAVSVGRFDGRESSAADRLARAMDASGIPTRASRNVQAELWGKILYNCALNPLGAILGVVYGKLAEGSATRDAMARIVRETYEVMSAHDLPRLWPTPEEFLRVFYERLVPPTARHTPSMLQDLRAGRRTEVDALNGAIVRLGEQAGVDTPVNATVVSMVRFLEKGGLR